MTFGECLCSKSDVQSGTLMDHINAIRGGFVSLDAATVSEHVTTVLAEKDGTIHETNNVSISEISDVSIKSIKENANGVC